MKLHYLLTAVAASALMAGAAHAQLGAGTSPDTGETPNQASPADPKDSQTGLPSVDATRPTGSNAGRTSLPQGEVSGDTDASAPSADLSSSTAVSASGSGVSASSGGNVQVISNGPVPDTPENRAKYGAPMSRAGKRTAAAGN